MQTGLSFFLPPNRNFHADFECPSDNTGSGFPRVCNKKRPFRVALCSLFSFFFSRLQYLFCPLEVVLGWFGTGISPVHDDGSR
nr:MAG TPA: hypothetical protein [Caudoviricetes sp.]